MARELEKSVHLHHTKKVMLFTHEDCGAYGTSLRFDGDAQKEFEFHIAEHKNAREYLRQRFPDLSVDTYFIDREGIVKTS